MTSVFTLLTRSLQFSSKRHTNPPVTQHSLCLLLAVAQFKSLPPDASDWTAAYVRQQRAHYRTNGRVNQTHAPPPHINNASAIEILEKNTLTLKLNRGGNKRGV